MARHNGAGRVCQLPICFMAAVLSISQLGCVASMSNMPVASPPAASLPKLVLQKGASHDFVFDRMDYEGKRDILPQIVVSLDGDIDQLRADQSFTLELFSNNCAERPFETIASPCVAKSMVSSAYGDAWQDRHGALRLTVTSGTITFTSLWIRVYTGSEVYRLTLISPKVEFDTDLGVKR